MQAVLADEGPRESVTAQPARAIGRKRRRIVHVESIGLPGREARHSFLAICPGSAKVVSE
jgi:hypothetical protein